MIPPRLSIRGCLAVANPRSDPRFRRGTGDRRAERMRGHGEAGESYTSPGEVLHSLLVVRVRPSLALLAFAFDVPARMSGARIANSLSRKSSTFDQSICDQSIPTLSPSFSRSRA